MKGCWCNKMREWASGPHGERHASFQAYVVPATRGTAPNSRDFRWARTFPIPIESRNVGEMTIPIVWGGRSGRGHHDGDALSSWSATSGHLPGMTSLWWGRGSSLPGLLSSVLLDPVTPEITEQGGGTDCYLITLGASDVWLYIQGGTMELVAWDEVVPWTWMLDLMW